MKKIKISTWVIIFLSTFSFVQAESYDIYVDINHSGIEDGSQVNPYNTIGEAIVMAEGNNKDHRKIYVAEGEYREQLDLTDDIELYGAGNDETVIYGKDALDNRFSYVVKMRNGTKIKDLQIKEGKYGLVINKDDKAKIEDCKIKKFKEIGIYVEKGAREDKDLFTLEDSKIYDGSGKGLYIKGRKIYLEGNEIYDNDEEGIDLRSKVKGKIKNNEIYDNGESNIELELREINLKFTSNKLKNSNSSGITAQYRGKNRMGELLVKRNSINKNNEYAINCNQPSGGKPPINYFSDSITLIQNKYKDNGNLYGPMCLF